MVQPADVVLERGPSNALMCALAFPYNAATDENFVLAEVRPARPDSTTAAPMADAQKPKYPPSSEREYRIAKPIMRFFSWLNTAVYEASGGRLLKKFPGGGPIGLLRVKGRTTGQQRTVPLCYAREGDRLVLIASQGGMPHHPLWYLNLRANPDVEFQIGTDGRSYTARFPEGEEREHYWRLACGPHPDFDEYQKRTPRRIPVIVLEPR